MDNWNDPDFLSKVRNPGLVEFLQNIFLEEGPPESFKEAFDILLNGLVSRFGGIPRQVFGAMFENFKKAAEVHDSALTMSFEELQKVDPFADMKGPSHRIISLNNVGTLESKVLQIDFLSPDVSKKFSKRLWDEPQVKARSMIKHFLAMPQTRSLAGSMFKPFAHRCIANPDETGGTWTLRLMSNGEDSNTFVLRDPSEPSETVPGFPRIKRELLSFQPKDLVHLYDNVYYTPTTSNHLFDSFVIGFSTPPEAQRLWLLQMTVTTSDSHKGSQKGYLVVQDIIEQIRWQQREHGQPSQTKKPGLKGKGKAEELLSVEVNYVLVCPAGERERKWDFPEGWEQQRNVYLLELSLDYDQKTRKRKASTSATTKRPPKETKASTSATTSTRRSTRFKNVSEVEE